MIKQRLTSARNEKDVENIYRAEFIKMDGSTITSPHGTDGLFQCGNIRTLLEFKYNSDLKNKLKQSDVLSQCLFYLKKFEDSGERLPSTIFIGDENEALALHTNKILKYLSMDIDWSKAPSSAHKNMELVQALVNDQDILPFVYNIDDNFRIKDIFDKIKDLTEAIVRKIRITKLNATTIYEYFLKEVIGDKSGLSSNELANLFVQIIINPGDNYLHPSKKNTLVSKGFGEIRVNQNLFRSFFKHFDGNDYSPKEKEELTALVDRLVEDVTRRSKGEFFTPTLFVNLAHEYLSEVYGEDWKERFIVWDNSCGTGNLTRDYKFKELYLSTLEQSDIDTSNQMGYNMEATKFQFDFLNDSDDKLPQSLRNAIESGKEILFLINPPYQDGSEKTRLVGDSEFKGNIQNSINSEMNINGWGRCSKQLYAQFLYRIWKFQQQNKNIKIALFSPPLFLTGESYKVFRENFFTLFGFESGFLFEAKHFSDVAKGWGISFTLFSETPNENKFNLDLIDFSENFELTKIKTKEVYNTDNEIKLVEWYKEKQVGEIESIGLKSALNHIQDIKLIPNNTLGTVTWQSNNIEGGQQFVTILSQYGRLSGKGSQFITKDNFNKSIVFFSARRLLTNNWVNSKDEYLAPNEQHTEYQQFEYDSIIYNLFNSASNQSSLRQVDYKGKKWDIKNEFFWLSKEEMLTLANDSNADEIYQDARTADERHVYNLLFKEGIYEKLSPDAKEILDIASDLLRKSIAARMMLSEGHPEYHLNSWDAGYAQLKLVWQQYFKEEFKAFRDKYNTFENRLRPLVYELGFLKS